MGSSVDRRSSQLDGSADSLTFRWMRRMACAPGINRKLASSPNGANADGEKKEQSWWDSLWGSSSSEEAAQQQAEEAARRAEEQRAAEGHWRGVHDPQVSDSF